MATRVEARARVEGGRALDARAANDGIAEKAMQLRFHSRVPMLCECGDPDCRKLVMISLDEYRAIRETPHNILTASGHEANRSELLKETPDYDIRRASSRGNGDRRSA
jgi:hypothetical protein